MMDCPNCGKFRGRLGCGCSWGEMLSAQRIKERRKRDSGEKRTVVDFLHLTEEERRQQADR